jgi:hypothetical protein
LVSRTRWPQHAVESPDAEAKLRQHDDLPLRRATNLADLPGALLARAHNRREILREPLPQLRADLVAGIEHKLERPASTKQTAVYA